MLAVERNASPVDHLRLKGAFEEIPGGYRSLPIETLVAAAAGATLSSSATTGSSSWCSSQRILARF